MVKHVGGVEVDLENADVFTMMDEHSYAAFVGVLSNIYMKAHACSPFRTTPYKAAIVISPSMLECYSGQPDTTLKRLNVIISQMKIPDNGIELGIFVDGSRGVFNKTAKIGLKHTVSQCWSMVNDTKHKDIITANLPPPQLNKGENKVRYFGLGDIKAAAKNKSLTFLDYNTPINRVIDSLSKSKVHISYQGGTAWLSVSMNIPTIIVHPIRNDGKMHLKFKLFGQDLGNINILNNNTISHTRMHPNEHHIYIDDLAKTLKEFL